MIDPRKAQRITKVTLKRRAAEKAQLERRAAAWFKRYTEAKASVRGTRALDRIKHSLSAVHEARPPDSKAPLTEAEKIAHLLVRQHVIKDPRFETARLDRIRDAAIRELRQLTRPVIDDTYGGVVDISEWLPPPPAEEPLLPITMPVPLPEPPAMSPKVTFTPPYAVGLDYGWYTIAKGGGAEEHRSDLNLDTGVVGGLIHSNNQDTTNHSLRINHMAHGPMVYYQVPISGRVIVMVDLVCNQSIHQTWARDEWGTSAFYQTTREQVCVRVVDVQSFNDYEEAYLNPLVPGIEEVGQEAASSGVVVKANPGDGRQACILTATEFKAGRVIGIYAGIDLFNTSFGDDVSFDNWINSSWTIARISVFTVAVPINL